MKPSCKLIEVAGIRAAITGMRLPTKSEGDSFMYESDFIVGEKDALLAKSLIGKGNVHGKMQRAIIAYLDINMPRYIWSELDTYTVGMLPTSSESTMYTLKKELIKAQTSAKSFEYTDAKAITNSFVDCMPEEAIEAFCDNIDTLSFNYAGIKSIPDSVLKSILPDGWMQRRIRGYSYQALKGMYRYRKHHRLHEWQIICDTIEKLPYFETLLLGCNKDKVTFDRD